MNEMYIVKYHGGEHDDSYKVSIFITSNKDTASKYCKKFNAILEKWKKHYSQYEGNPLISDWIKDEYDQYYDRWYSLKQITMCYFEAIELR